MRKQLICKYDTDPNNTTKVEQQQPQDGAWIDQMMSASFTACRNLLCPVILTQRVHNRSAPFCPFCFPTQKNLQSCSEAHDLCPRMKSLFVNVWLWLASCFPTLWCARLLTRFCRLVHVELVAAGVDVVSGVSGDVSGGHIHVGCPRSGRSDTK